MTNWTNLHSHTVFSALDGHGQVETYAKRAADLGMEALAITDHGNISGWIDFYESCQDNGVKPILGMEAYMARKTRFDMDEEELAGAATDEFEQRGPYHLTLLAKNKAGYHNLIKLSSKAFLEGLYGKPRIDYDLLEEHNEGLIVGSGCLSGPVSQALLRGDVDAAADAAVKLQNIVGKDNFFIEVMDHTIEEEREVLPQLKELAEALDARVVPTGDCHYVHEEDSNHHDVMICVSTQSKLHEEDRFKFMEKEFYLRSYDEMRERFPAEWLQNTMDIADMVEEIELDRGTMYFPEFEIPTDEEPNEYFERLVWEGIEFRYGSEPAQEVIDRTLYELRIIKRLGFPPYFLVVSDLVNWMKKNDIKVGYGRGSAAGSIVSYAMRITNLDPLRFGLMFERFLLPEEVEYEPVLEKV